MDERLKRLFDIKLVPSEYRVNPNDRSPDPEPEPPRPRTYRIMCQVDGEQPCTMFTNIDIGRNFEMIIKPPQPGTDNVYLTIFNKATNRTVRIYGEPEQ